MEPKELEITRKRRQFAKNYCKEKGWPVKVDDLSVDQILEIRKQPGWKNPN